MLTNLFIKIARCEKKYLQKDTFLRKFLSTKYWNFISLLSISMQKFLEIYLAKYVELHCIAHAQVKKLNVHLK